MGKFIIQLECPFIPLYYVCLVMCVMTLLEAVYSLVVKPTHLKQAEKKGNKGIELEEKGPSAILWR